MKKKILLTAALAAAMLMTGCSGSGNTPDTTTRKEPSTIIAGNQNSNSTNNDNKDTASDSEGNNNTAPSVSATELTVRFGDNGSPFTLHLYDNPTAAAIAKHVGTASWRLPIYHYDDYDNWEVMQYYDIPSRYEIPSNPENITSEKAGEVYYSEPNRIILFFGDGQVSSEYTKVGYFDYSEEFKSAVENNPVLEGWGNKLVLIDSAD